jgi:hypothetical protein
LLELQKRGRSWLRVKSIFIHRSTTQLIFYIPLKLSTNIPSSIACYSCRFIQAESFMNCDWSCKGITRIHNKRRRTTYVLLLIPVAKQESTGAFKKKTLGASSLSKKNYAIFYLIYRLSWGLAAISSLNRTEYSRGFTASYLVRLCSKNAFSL